MSVYIYMYIYMYTHICIYMRIYVNVFTCIHVKYMYCMHENVRFVMYPCNRIFSNVLDCCYCNRLFDLFCAIPPLEVCVHTYVYVLVYMYILIHTFICCKYNYVHNVVRMHNKVPFHVLNCYYWDHVCEFLIYCCHMMFRFTHICIRICIYVINIWTCKHINKDI